MFKGKSYIIFTDKQKPKHRIVKLLRTFGIVDFTLTYASHWATDAGWTIEQNVTEATSTILSNTWLGHTIKEASKNIHSAKTKESQGKTYLRF